MIRFRSGATLKLRGSTRHLAVHSPRRIISTSSLSTARSSTHRGAFLSHPATFLLHLSGITLGTMMMPYFVAKRQLSSTIQPDAPSHSKEATSTLVDTRIQPSPTPRQLINLANSLRRQFKAPSIASFENEQVEHRTPIPTPFDAIFTLRQLHLYQQRPHLTLLYPSNVTLIKPEKWIWRLPTTCALHSLMRYLLHPRCPERTKDELRELVMRLLRHALYWDRLIWCAHLRSVRASPFERDEGSEEGDGWWFKERFEGRITGQGAERDVVVPLSIEYANRLELTRTDEATVKRIEEMEARKRKRLTPTQLRRRDRRRQMSEKLDGLNDQLDKETLDSIEPVQSIVSNEAYNPLSSIPIPTLELIVDHLAERSQPSQVRNQAFEISMSMTDLSFRRSQRSLARSFDLAIDLDRIDQAARFWSAAYGTSRVDPELWKTRLKKMRLLLKCGSRVAGRKWSNEIDRKRSSAIVTLSRSLERVWHTSSSLNTGPSPMSTGHDSPSVDTNSDLVVGNILLGLVTTFPRAPKELKGTRAHQIQDAVYSSHRAVIIDVLSRLLGYHIIRPDLRRPNRYTLGDRISSSHDIPKVDVITFNLLLAYALRQLHSTPIALELLSKMAELSIPLNATTCNLVQPIHFRNTILLSRPVKAALRALPQDDYTYAMLVKTFVSTRSEMALRRLILRLLPEMNSNNHSAPPPDRPIYIYTAILSALAKFGNVGLAERVFRSARWASRLSRSNELKVKRKWVLPPSAFISMLMLYAQQARKKRSFVKGYGRRGLRIYKRDQRMLELARTWGDEDVETHRDALGFKTRNVQLGEIVRGREVAKIIALYELEKGSEIDPDEMKNLSKAMKSPVGRRCVEIIFGQPQGEKIE